jgi:hypothetical protein
MPNALKSTLSTLIFAFILGSGYAQSLIGTWQLVKQTTCLSDELGGEDAETEELVLDMQSQSSGTNSVIRFKDNSSGEENVRIIDSRKSSRLNTFLYKFDGNNLYLLDKKSKLLLGSYTVENFTADSLIFSNAARPCETRVFVKISEKK